MGVYKVALLYNIVFFLLGGSRSSEGCNNDLTGASAAIRLSNDLFCAYDSNVRPVVNQSSQITVDTRFYIFNVHMDGLLASIKIYSCHYHTLETAEALRFLPAKKSLQDTFIEYFNNGMGIIESTKFHEHVLSLNDDFNKKNYANGAINPTYRCVQNWHEQWRLKNLGPRSGSGLIENEKWDILQMSIQLVMDWTDEFLVWDPSKYDNIQKMYKESSHIWVPDIMSYDTGFNGDINGDYSYFLPISMVRINNKGRIKYNHRITLNAQCTTNIAEWPFDSHNCTFLIGSPVYTNVNVNYSFTHGYYNMDYYKPSREWEVSRIGQECMNVFQISNSSMHCILQYDISITRFSTMYYSSIVIPAVVISLMKIFTFFMGREFTLRFILLSLIFISELLYIQFLDTKLPNNGRQTVYIVLLYRNSLILTAIALIITVISNEFYKHGTDDFPRNGPEWLKSVSTFLLNKKPIAVLTNFNTRGAELLIEKNVEEESPNTQRDENALFWKTLSNLLDRLSFVITLVISLINLWFLIP